MSHSVLAAGWTISNSFMMVAPSLLIVTRPCVRFSKHQYGYPKNNQSYHVKQVCYGSKYPKNIQFSFDILFTALDLLNWTLEVVSVWDCKQWVVSAVKICAVIFNVIIKNNCVWDQSIQQTFYSNFDFLFIALHDWTCQWMFLLASVCAMVSSVSEQTINDRSFGAACKPRTHLP